jgi:glucan phosphoethanolaminetransferase (alkaline phosphatase superfamily)
LLLTATAAVVFPDRPRVVLFITLVWSVFFGVLDRHGYGPLAVQAVGVFWLVSLADRLNFIQLPGLTIVSYAAFLMAVFGGVVVLHQRLPRRLRSLPLLFAAAFSLAMGAIAAVHIWHNLVFDVAVTPDVLFAIYQTNARELTEFLWEFLDLSAIVAVLSGILGIGLLSYAQRRTPGGTVPPGLLAAMIAVPIGMLAPSGGDVRIVTHLAESVAEYRRELGEFRRLRDLRTAGSVKIHATKAGGSETYVVVIGESLNRNHMQLYGYHRNTTPRLDSLYRAGDLLKFNNAHSTHTNSMPSLSLALTAASRRNEVAFFEAPSVIEVAKAAGIETHWVTNQVLYGPFDHLVSIVAHEADELVALNRNVGETAETQRYDEATIHALEAILGERTARSRLIVVHLSGSHTIYCRRFPPGFDRFSGPLPAGAFGRARGNEQLARSVNCYDNSVLYNDYVVAGLLEAVRRQGGVAGFLYFADHGEDVLGRNGHHSGRFTFPMVEIPMLAWLSEGYRREYPARYAALRTRTDAIVGTDVLFDTVLGMVGIETSERDDHGDLSGPAWDTNSMELGLLDGERHFLDDANRRYHQRRNLAKLAESGLLSRILPHRVNSTGKLAQVWYDGCRGVEVDLLFRSGTGEGYFEVGHDEGYASGVRLADFLERMPPGRLEKLWFDVKNLDAGNLDAVRSEMARLDRRFGLKHTVIFESPAAEVLPGIGREGFSTSYYLPTELLIELYETRDEDGLREEAARIARVVRNGELSAVSFDSRLYAFVKKYLEPRLAEGVAYHTWDTTLQLASPSFLERIGAMDWFTDTRVETIFVTYYSEMTL